VYNTSETGSKGIIYEDLIAVLTSAVQESHARMEHLRAEAIEREHEISVLTTVVRTLVNQTIAIEESMRRLRGRINELENGVPT
jgi:hypothetical protein